MEGSQNDSRKDKIMDCWTSFLEKSVNKCNLQAKLIFIPMQDNNHYFCVCINFSNEKVYVLDNKAYSESEWLDSNVYKLARLVADSMSDFLESSRNDASEIIGFEVIQEEFDWHKSDSNDKESGLFLLMHMLCYEGQSFQMAPLEKKTSRRSLVLQIAATILLADINNDRDKLLTKIETFISEKPVFWKNLEAKRKLNAIVEKKGLNVDDTTKQKIGTEVPVLRIKIDDKGQAPGRGQAKGQRRGRCMG